MQMQSCSRKAASFVLSELTSSGKSPFFITGSHAQVVIKLEYAADLTTSEAFRDGSLRLAKFRGFLLIQHGMVAKGLCRKAIGLLGARPAARWRRRSCLDAGPSAGQKQTATCNM